MTKPFKIWIEDKETFKKVLKQMDKEGIRWYMSGDCASSRIGCHDVPIALFVDSYNKLSWADNKLYFKDHEYNEITPEEYLNGDKTMTKADLKDWMIVETAEQSIFLVDKTHGYLIHDCGHMSLSDYTDDLKYCSLYGRDYSIVKVYEPKKGLEYLLKVYLTGTFNDSFHKIEEDLNLIWERDEEPVELTIAEIEEKLGIKNLKIVKENENG